MTKVYCQDSSNLLQHTIDVHQGKNVPSLKSYDNKECPSMPKQGEVDFIFGGMTYNNLSHTLLC
jgi:DNA (cytosine-5)-methyltransferase 1